MKVYFKRKTLDMVNILSAINTYPNTTIQFVKLKYEMINRERNIPISLLKNRGVGGPEAG